jgi:hypothetical protein
VENFIEKSLVFVEDSVLLQITSATENKSTFAKLFVADRKAVRQKSLAPLLR